MNVPDLKKVFQRSGSVSVTGEQDDCDKRRNIRSHFLAESEEVWGMARLYFLSDPSPNAGERVGHRREGWASSPNLITDAFDL